MNSASIHEDAGSIPRLAQCGLRICVGHRRVLDLQWLWLWCRPAAAALIQPLAWELPYTAGAALKRQKDKKKGGGLEVLGTSWLDPVCWAPRKPFQKVEG